MPPSSRQSARVQARALAWQSQFAEKMGDIESADRLVERSLSLLDRIELESSESAGPAIRCRPGTDLTADDRAADSGRAEKALALWSKAMYTYQIDVELTRQLFERSLALFRALDERWWAGRALFELSRTASWHGKRQEAERLTTESLAIFRSLGDRWGCASALNDLGKLAMYRGRLDEAERLKRQALTEAGGPRGWDETDIELDEMYLVSGKFTQALRGFERRVALYAELQLKIRLVEATGGVIACLLHLGRYKRAYALAKDNLSRCLEAGYRLYTGGAHRAVAAAELARGQLSVAQCHLDESVRIVRETVGGAWLAEGLALLGYAARARDRRVVAEQHLTEALSMAMEGRFWMPLLTMLPGLALLLADRSELERAVELHALASRHPYVAGSRWFEDVAGQELDALADILPPEVVSAAQERGRGRDLWVTAEELLAELEG